MIYRNPVTGETRRLGVRNTVLRAKGLERAGWARLDGPPLLPEATRDDLSEIPSISAELALALRQAGLVTFEALRQASDEELLRVSGIGYGRLRAIREHFERCDNLHQES